MRSVGIIGAGPAGLSMARLLRERGFGPITLFERDTVIGGKVASVEHGGAIHELGACYLTAGYTRVRRWMREADAGLVHLRDNVMSDGQPIQDWVFADGAVAGRLDMLRYFAAWGRYRLRDAVGALGPAHDEALARPFAEWLDDRGLVAAERMARRSTVAMGYGFLDALPTLYGLRWNTPSAVLTGLLRELVVAEAGWQRFWQQLATSFDVRFGAEVVDLRRHGDCTLVLADGVTHRFDEVVVTIPLRALAAFDGASDEERWLGARSVVNRYASTLCAIDGWFTDADTRAYADRLLPPGDGPRDRFMVARRTVDKGSARNPGNLYVLYQYVDPRHDPRTAVDATTAGLRRRLVDQLRAGLEAEGATLTAVIDQRVWDYMPHFTAEAIAQGAVRRLDRLQGTRHTWYSGASTVLESIDNIVDANAVLALDMAHAAAGGSRAVHRVRRVLARVSPHTW